jgi:glycerol-3-phosphate dehydrogenase
LAFLDRAACLDALPRVVELIAAERGWGRGRQRAELARAKVFLETFEATHVAPPDGKVKVGEADASSASKGAAPVA